MTLPMAAAISPAAESGNNLKKKKKNLFSFFQKKTKSKKKYKASTAFEQNNNVTTVNQVVAHLASPQHMNGPVMKCDGSSYIHATQTEPTPPIMELFTENAEQQVYKHEEAVAQLPGNADVPVTSSDTPEEPVSRHVPAMAMLLSNTDVQVQVVYSRSSSHSSGFDEISASITECSCNNEQVKVVPHSFVDDTVPSADNNELANAVPLNYVDGTVPSTDNECLDTLDEAPRGVICDVIADREDKQSTTSNGSTVTDASHVVQANSDGGDTLSPIEVAMTTQGLTSSLPVARPDVAMSDATAANLSKLRAVTARINAAKLPSSAASSKTTILTNRPSTFALNSAFRHLLATGNTAQTASKTSTTPGLSEQLTPALTQPAPKWHQPSLPAVARANPPSLPRSNSIGSSTSVPPPRNVRRTRQSNQNTPPPSSSNGNPFRSSHYGSSDATSSASHSLAEHHDDNDDVTSSLSSTDVNGGVIVDEVSYRRRYSSALQLNESTRDVVETAKTKKAEQRRRLNVCTTVTRCGNDLRLGSVPRDQPRHSVGSQNDLRSRDVLSRNMINPAAVSGTSRRNMQAAVSVENIARMPRSRNSPMSDRYIELTQSFDRWRQQLTGETSSTPMMSSFSQLAFGRQDSDSAAESDLVGYITGTSSSPSTPSRIEPITLSSVDDAPAAFYDTPLEGESARSNNQASSDQVTNISPWQRSTRTEARSVTTPRSITSMTRRSRDLVDQRGQN